MRTDVGYVNLEQKGVVATVTIDRQERRNALTAEICKEISASVRQAAEGARVIILTGAGSAFSAGGDFRELAAYAAEDAKVAAEGLYDGFQGMIRAIRRVRVPVIAAVNGPAMGAGMDLALACDLRIAAVEARFGQVWVKVGLIPGTAGAFWVTALAGAGRASEMTLTGETIKAEQAYEWGLVSEVVAMEWLLPRAEELANSLAENPPGALADNKRLINEIVFKGYDEALELAREAQVERFASEEFSQAVGTRLKAP